MNHSLPRRGAPCSPSWAARPRTPCMHIGNPKLKHVVPLTVLYNKYLAYVKYKLLIHMILLLIINLYTQHLSTHTKTALCYTCTNIHLHCGIRSLAVTSTEGSKPPNTSEIAFLIPSSGRQVVALFLLLSSMKSTGNIS